MGFTTGILIFDDAEELDFVGPWEVLTAARMLEPEDRVVTIAGRRIALYHRLYEGGAMTQEGRAFLDRARPEVCVFGHTHRPTTERLGGILLFNPGSAGPKRFTLPRGIGLLLIYSDAIMPVYISLPDRAQSSLE